MKLKVNFLVLAANLLFDLSCIKFSPYSTLFFVVILSSDE